MHYPMRLLDGEPRFDSLGVLKLGCAHNVPINERIYAQAQIGRTCDLVFARIWSFETSPAPETTLSAVFEHGGHTLRMSTSAAGRASVSADGTELSGAMTSYAISGEDLQGEYWGVVMMIPTQTFFSSLELSAHQQPILLTGNVLREHQFVSAAAEPGESLELELQ